MATGMKAEADEDARDSILSEAAPGLVLAVEHYPVLVLMSLPCVLPLDSVTFCSPSSPSYF